MRESLLTTNAEEGVVLTLPKEFRPVNDEYQPFHIEGKRRSLQSNFGIPACLRTLRLPTQQRILEIGCGLGDALIWLAKECGPKRLAGIDISSQLLQKAEENLQISGTQAELYQEDVRNLPFEDASFDLVIDFGTCYHINRRVRALKEISRILAPGGIFAHETRLGQMLAHPLRAFGKQLPWKFTPDLAPHHFSGLWASKIKLATA